MTNEQMERAIEFLLDHHARFMSEMTELRASIAELKGSVVELKTTVEVDRQQHRERFEGIEAQAESDRHEIREAIGNLIIGNEVTRDLAQKVAALQLQMGQQVGDIDQRVTNLESKQDGK